MFKNKKISEMHKQGVRIIRFDPDSSPAALMHLSTNLFAQRILKYSL